LCSSSFATDVLCATARLQSETAKNRTELIFLANIFIPPRIFLKRCDGGETLTDSFSSPFFALPAVRCGGDVLSPHGHLCSNSMRVVAYNGP